VSSISQREQLRKLRAYRHRAMLIGFLATTAAKILDFKNSRSSES
jgi:hypothetical protein